MHLLDREFYNQVYIVETALVFAVSYAYSIILLILSVDTHQWSGELAKYEIPAHGELESGSVKCDLVTEWTSRYENSHTRPVTPLLDVYSLQDQV